jgi:hypothetical protein
MNKTLNKTLIASAIGLSLMGAGTANAALVTGVFGNGTWDTQSANFTMLDGNAHIVGGTNDVTMHWDGNAYNSSSDYTGPGSSANVTASSPTLFFSHNWTAHDIQVFTPGSYSFDTSIGTTNASLFQTMVVGSSQLGMHMLFDWNGSLNIDVVVVANNGQIFGSGIASNTHSSCASTVANCLWTGGALGPAGRPAGNHVWMLASVDQAGGDGTPGSPMIDGPFGGFNANFNADLAFTPAAAVPVPAAAWLFGSGLMGLAAVARRKKKA